MNRLTSNCGRSFSLASGYLCTLSNFDNSSVSAGGDEDVLAVDVDVLLLLVVVDGIMVVLVVVVEFTFSILSILPKLGRAAEALAPDDDGRLPSLPPLDGFFAFIVVALWPPGVVWNCAGGVSFFCEMSASVFVISNEPLITDCVTARGGAGELARLLPINDVVAENL